MQNPESLQRVYRESTEAFREVRILILQIFPLEQSKAKTL